MTENEAIDILEEFHTDKPILEMIYGKCHDEALKTAISALEEIQKYRAIGTVEECREATEKHRVKKPEYFYKKHRKHKWERDEKGEIDEFAFDVGEHSGVVCEICGKCVCTMCNPEYDELEDYEEEYWICPNCGRKMYSEHEYCECGQHLDWSKS